MGAPARRGLCTPRLSDGWLGRNTKDRCRWAARFPAQWPRDSGPARATKPAGSWPSALLLEYSVLVNANPAASRPELLCAALVNYKLVAAKPTCAWRWR